MRESVYTLGDRLTDAKHNLEFNSRTELLKEFWTREIARLEREMEAGAREIMYGPRVEPAPEAPNKDASTFSFSVEEMERKLGAEAVARAMRDSLNRAEAQEAAMREILNGEKPASEAAKKAARCQCARCAMESVVNALVAPPKAPTPSAQYRTVDEILEDIGRNGLIPVDPQGRVILIRARADGGHAARSVEMLLRRE
jgi:hypothetical protein